MKVDITANKSYTIIKKSGRVLILQLNNIKPVETYETYTLEDRLYSTDNIVKLRFSKTNTISVGDILTIENIKFNISDIQRGEKDIYYLLDSKPNKSAKYILPLIAENLTATNFLFKSWLYNTYLYWDKCPQYSNGKYLFVCYKFIQNSTYKQMETLLTNNINFIEVIEADYSKTVFVFEIPYKYKYSVNQIINGDYHLLDGEIKNKIITFFSPVENSNKEYKQLYEQTKRIFERNDVEVKRLEKSLGCNLPTHIGVESKPDITNETLKL